MDQQYKAVIHSDIDPTTEGQKYIGYVKIYKIGEGEVVHDIVQSLGKTREEAAEKMREQVRAWITKQGGTLAAPLN